jgi:chromate reductase
MMKLSRGSLKLEIIEIRELPLYNQDNDDNPSAAWTEFRDRPLRAGGYDG